MVNMMIKVYDHDKSEIYRIILNTDIVKIRLNNHVN